MAIVIKKCSKQSERESAIISIDQERISNAKRAYTTRRTDLTIARYLLAGAEAPRAGDLVLARVENIGQHQRIELPDGRRSRLYIGNELIVCYGARYAPDQFESRVPGDLGPCDLVAAGGVASSMISKHSRMKHPTQIVPVGLIADQVGKRMNIRRWGLARSAEPRKRPPTIAVIGTSMNAGKTSCGCQIVHGLRKRGLKVGATKVTGTGAGGDRWVMTDAGANIVLDFTDAGVPSTFGLNNKEVIDIFNTLTGHLADNEVDVIVLEVADGLLHGETAELLQSAEFRMGCDGIVFAAGDAMGSAGGVETLRSWGLNVLAVSGFLTSSQLAIREAEKLVDVPVIHTDELANTNFFKLLKNMNFLSEANAFSRKRCGGPRVYVSADVVNGQPRPATTLNNHSPF
ncbi:MAG: hypothetical protein ACE5FM_00210 [Methyloligellaceae bacterium]